MITKVDYLSYTYTREGLLPTGDDWTRGLWEALKAGMPDYIETDGESKVAPKRYGFVVGVNIDNHTFVWMSRKGLFLVEHTGAGCDHLESRGILTKIIHERAENLTRIDIATDILTDTRPNVFVNARGKTRSTAIGYFKSDSGETVYVGSKKSNRNCKVYRYDGKHPRSHLLRIEDTYKHQDAKIVGNALKSSNLAEIAKNGGARYRWMHPDWQPDLETSEIELKAYRPERRQSKTVTWLYTQVIASVTKMHQSGHLDIEDYINAIRRETGTTAKVCAACLQHPLGGEMSSLQAMDTPNLSLATV